MTADQNQNSANRDRRLRLCFISHQYPPAVIGGVGRFTADLAAGFAGAGHDVHVISSQGGVCGAALENNVWVHRIPDLVAIPDVMKQERAGLFLSRMAAVYREVRLLHEEEPFDIVSSPIFLAEGLLIAMDPRFVSILSLHTSSNWGSGVSDPDELAGSRPLAALEMQCIRAHSHTHANSHAAVKAITTEYSTPNGVFIIPHGVNDESSRYARDRGDDGRFRVLLVGLLDKRKGADVLYDIIPRILSRFPRVEFLHVGPANPMQEFGRQTLPAALAKRFGKRPDILRRMRFTGVASDEEVYRAYANADLLLLPSRYESFGLAVTEAMSFGLPVVAWKAGGVTETMLDGETGILIDVEDREGLIEAVGRLASDPALCRQFGEAGRRRYLAHFSTATSIPHTIAAYRRILETAPPLSERQQPGQRGAVTHQFAAIIERVTAVRGEPALQTAQRLVDSGGSREPRVGVIVTGFNSADHVAAALDSIRAQSYRNFSCVIVDDASSDHSADIVANWITEKQDGRFSLLRNEVSRGRMACAARGAASCDGELVAFLDPRDSWHPDFLRFHVGVIHETAVGVSRSDRQSRDSQAQVSGGLPPVRFEGPRDLNRSWGIASVIMIQRSFFDAVMPRDTDDPAICAQAYFFTLCHLISGSFFIDRPLANVCGRGAMSKQDDDVVVVRASLRHLLDYPPKLASLLPPRGRAVLVRTLVRRCLRAGVAIDDRRVYGILGSRVWRDWLRAKVWFLRRTLV